MRSKYDYNTMPDAKKIVAAMKRKSKEDREESLFFNKRKDTFRYWMTWLFGAKLEVIDELEVEEDEIISLFSWLNWWFGIKLDIIDNDGTENDNNAGLDTDETQELRQGETSNEN
jgi:hypothetical protein